MSKSSSTKSSSTKSAFTKPLFATVFAANAMLALAASPVFADVPDLKGGPDQVIKQIDELANKVYVPGKAKEAGEDLRKFCEKVSEKLRTWTRKDWEPVARHCTDARREMCRYNNTGQVWDDPNCGDRTVSQLVPVKTTQEVARTIDVSSTDYVAYVPPVVIEVPSRLYDREVGRDEGRLHDRNVRRDDVARETPNRSTDKIAKADTGGSHAANRPMESTTHSSAATRTGEVTHANGLGAAHSSGLGAIRTNGFAAARTSNLGAARAGSFGGMHATHLASSGASRMGSFGGGRMAGFGGMHFGRR